MTEWLSTGGIRYCNSFILYMYIHVEPNLWHPFQTSLYPSQDTNVVRMHAIKTWADIHTFVNMTKLRLSSGRWGWRTYICHFDEVKFFAYTWITGSTLHFQVIASGTYNVSNSFHTMKNDFIHIKISTYRTAGDSSCGRVSEANLHSHTVAQLFTNVRSFYPFLLFCDMYIVSNRWHNTCPCED
jgi:hypothetical protein